MTIFDLSELEETQRELQARMTLPDFWDDQQAARRITKQASEIDRKIEGISQLEEKLDELELMLELSEEAGEAEFEAELNRGLKTVGNLLSKLRWQLYLDGEYDDRRAILSINPGAGGTEAHDWAEMLFRMYRRWAESESIDYKILNISPGEEAGIKNLTMLLDDSYAYGKLKGESGVHRLVRISPFDSNSRRHTSFAAVQVAPDLEIDDEVEIDESDLRVDTFRSSGPGGQHANMTDSAVRITHQPSGLVVKCQNERSQHKNRATAMKILKSRLLELKIQQQKDDIKEIKGAKQSIEWGSQIRSYVNHPYQQVKDHRTGYEINSFEKVLDGELDGFIEAYLSSDVS